MKILHKFFLVFVSLCISTVAFSQVELSSSEEEAFRAKVISVAEQTNSIISDFVQEKHLSVLDNVIKSEGKMVFLMPDKIRWEYTTPYHNIAIFKDHKLYVNNEGKKESFDLNSNKIFKSFNQLIVQSIKGDMFNEQQFVITYYSSDAGYLVKFVPKEKRLKKLVSAFELTFDKNSAKVQQVKMVENNGDYTLIKFLYRKDNTKIDDSSFKI